MLMFFQTFGTYCQHFAMRQFHTGRREPRNPQRIFSRRRSHRIKAQRTEQIPGRHLSAVVISRQSIRPVLVMGIQDFRNTFPAPCRNDRNSYINTHNGDRVHCHAGNARCRTRYRALRQRLVTSHQIYQAPHIRMTQN